MYSIYHFFAYLVHNRGRLAYVPRLVDFPFNPEPLSFSGDACFPELEIRINPGGDPPGGELIGVKDSDSYCVPAFKSHIPTGAMSIDYLGHGKASGICEAMQTAGDEALSLPVREVYYFLRGKSLCYAKICLVHGSFFETVKAEELLRQAFAQVLADTLEDEGQVIDPKLHQELLHIFPREYNYNKVRHVDNAVSSTQI